MVKIAKLSAVALMALSLGACETTNEVQWEVEAECNEANGCGVRGKLSGSFGGSEGQALGRYASGSAPLTELILSSGGVPDAAQFALQVSGTIEYPASGQVVVELLDSATNTVQAVEVFSWVRTGSTIVLADPDAVNTWALENGGTADTMNYDLVPWAPTAPPGVASIQVQSSYEGSVTAADFSSYCFSDDGGLMEQEVTLCP